jgi:hypothetical protein
MAHKAALAAVLLVLFCAVALAQPCIECKDCRGSNNCEFFVCCCVCQTHTVRYVGVSLLLRQFGRAADTTARA